MDLNLVIPLLSEFVADSPEIHLSLLSPLFATANSEAWALLRL